MNYHQPICPSSVRRLWLSCALTFAWPAFALADSVVTDASLTNLYAALLGGGRITFAAAVAFTFNLTNPIPVVRDTFLDGGPTNRSPIVFNGGNATRLFTVCSNVTLQLVNVTLINGRSTNGGAVLNQGGTLLASDCLFNANQGAAGGAILNQAGIVRATNCVFRGNAAVGLPGADGAAGSTNSFVGGDGGPGAPGTTAAGGAIYGLAPAEFHRCRFAGNTATGGRGGLGGVGGAGGSKGGNGGNGGDAGAAFGGAIYSTNRLVLSNCTFDGNAVNGGNGGQGGLAGPQSSTNSAAVGTAGLSRAGASAEGGAVFAVGQLLASSCTFANNTAAGGQGAGESSDYVGLGRQGPNGGAALGGAISGRGTSAWVNCTFFGNVVQGGLGGSGGSGTVYSGGNGGGGGPAFGGALWVVGQTGATNCTFASGSATGGLGGAGGAAGTGGLINHAGDAGTIGSAGGGNLATQPGGTLPLLNCIVASSLNGGNAYGGLVDAGHNLSSDATCHFTTPTSRNSTDPLLGALGDYGGPTESIPLLVTTDSQGCQGCNGILVRSPAIDAGAAIPGVDTDQRGVARPQGKAVDIGAFECVALGGQVRQYDGSPFVNATIWLFSTFSPPLKTVADAQGRYQIVAPPDMTLNLGIYWLAPEVGGVIFAPANSPVDLPVPANRSINLDFSEVVALGQVRQGDGSPFTNVTVSLVSGASPLVTAVTDAQGRYQLVAPPNAILGAGVYQVTPQVEGAVLSPLSLPVQLGSPRTSTNLAFTECVALGQVRQCDGRSPFPGVTISLVSTSSPPQEVVSTATDDQGRYQLVAPPNMTLNAGLYRVVPQAGAAVFSPASVEVQVGSSKASRPLVDFTSPLVVGVTTQRGFRLTGWAAPGRVFRVETAPALPAPFWQPLGTVTNGVDGLLDFTDPTAWYFPTRFYRLVPQSPQPGP